MLRSEMFRIMAENFTVLLELHGKAQKEYTLKDEAFDNFNRLSTNLNIDRKLVLWVYLQKHLDGVMNFIRGHEMQREDVEGRLDDAIVYLQLLRGMIREERLKSIQDRQPVAGYKCSYGMSADVPVILEGRGNG